MKLWTVQHKNVIEKINREGIYIANGEHSWHYHERGKKAYDLIIKRLKAYPIWTLNSYEGTQLAYDFIKENLKNIGHILPIGAKDSILLELEKPDDECILTDYYNWVDVLYYYQDAVGKNKKQMELNGLNKIEHAFDLRKDCSIQAVIKDIKNKDIVSLYDLI